MSDPEDPELENAGRGDQYCELLDNLKKRRLGDENISYMINISKLPKNENHFKIMVESDRLTKDLEKKIKQIDSRFSKLEKDIDQLRKISDEKKRKTDDYIQEINDMTSMIIGEIMKKHYILREKADGMKSAIDTETANIRINEAREKTEVEEAIKNLGNILAMIQERFDETQTQTEEKVAEQVNKLEREIENMKEKEAKENDRLDRQLQRMEEQKAKEKTRIDKMQEKMARKKNNLEKDIETLRTTLNKAKEENQNNIRALKKDRAELKRRIEAEKNEMKSHKLRVKRKSDVFEIIASESDTYDSDYHESDDSESDDYRSDDDEISDSEIEFLKNRFNDVKTRRRKDVTFLT